MLRVSAKARSTPSATLPSERVNGTRGTPASAARRRAPSGTRSATAVRAGSSMASGGSTWTANSGVSLRGSRSASARSTSGPATSGRPTGTNDRSGDASAPHAAALSWASAHAPRVTQNVPHRFAARTRRMTAFIHASTPATATPNVAAAFVLIRPYIVVRAARPYASKRPTSSVATHLPTNAIATNPSPIATPRPIRRPPGGRSACSRIRGRRG